MWPFKLQSSCDLFRVVTAEPENGQEEVFSVHGTPDPETGFIRTYDHISALIRGKARTEYPGHGTYVSEDLAYICPLTNEKQCNPPGMGLSVPLDNLMYMSVVQTGEVKHPLDFEVVRRGRRKIMVFSPPKPCYYFAVRGEIEGLELFEIEHHGGTDRIELTCKPDTIVFFVWTRD